MYTCCINICEITVLVDLSPNYSRLTHFGGKQFFFLFTHTQRNHDLNKMYGFQFDNSMPFCVECAVVQNKVITLIMNYKRTLYASKNILWHCNVVVDMQMVPIIPNAVCLSGLLMTPENRWKGSFHQKINFEDWKCLKTKLTNFENLFDFLSFNINQPIQKCSPKSKTSIAKKCSFSYGIVKIRYWQ